MDKKKNSNRKALFVFLRVCVCVKIENTARKERNKNIKLPDPRDNFIL